MGCGCGVSALRPGCCCCFFCMLRANSSPARFISCSVRSFWWVANDQV